MRNSQHCCVWQKKSVKHRRLKSKTRQSTFWKWRCELSIQTWWISGTGKSSSIRIPQLMLCTVFLVLERWHRCRRFFNKSTYVAALSLRNVCVGIGLLSSSRVSRRQWSEKARRLRAATETHRETSTPIYCVNYLPLATALPALIHFIVLSLIKLSFTSLILFHIWED